MLAALTFAAALLEPRPACAQNVAVEEHVLDNGLRLLLLQRKGDPNIAAGWIARVGSVNERPGITGVAHLFEHMMFKGTRVIGTRDIERNLEVMRELDRVKEELAKEEALLEEKVRLGEAEADDPAVRSPRHCALLEELARLGDEERKTIVKDEFDRVYTTAGATGMNAGTTNDFTIYFINVPANKLELWCWMESDRLLNPVFREFYSERDVVREERRMRTESTPLGIFDEEFEALFWTSSPYGWPVVGWPSDIEAVTRSEALEFFDVYYAPNNLTACIVGDFEPARALELVKRYFGRLKRGPREPTPFRTREVKQSAERRLTAYAETKPQVTIRYHTVADGHADDPALTVLASLLSGRTGRLYKGLVLGSQVATEASARHDTLHYDGYFELQGVAREGKTTEDVEKALYAELDKLASEPPGERELQKVKNILAANDFRRLLTNFHLLLQLLTRDASRSWRSINTDPPRLQAVTAQDVARVAKAYLTPENRTVATYLTKPAAAGAPQADETLAGLSTEDAQKVRQVRTFLESAGPEDCARMLEGARAQLQAVPPEKRPLLEALVRTIEDHLKKKEEGASAR